MPKLTPPSVSCKNSFNGLSGLPPLSGLPRGLSALRGLPAFGGLVPGTGGTGLLERRLRLRRAGGAPSSAVRRSAPCLRRRFVWSRRRRAGRQSGKRVLGDGGRRGAVRPRRLRRIQRAPGASQRVVHWRVLLEPQGVLAECLVGREHGRILGGARPANVY